MQLTGACLLIFCGFFAMLGTSRHLILIVLTNCTAPHPHDCLTVAYAATLATHQRCGASKPVPELSLSLCSGNMSRQQEQRLHAIYDAFDARNYKGAIKLANAALQKCPDVQLFKALKAVALERADKMQEALQLTEEVLAAAPPDDHTLNMLLLVLKPANRIAELLPAYQAACAKASQNEELLQGLFACNVRCFNFQEQQAVAVKLNKLRPSEQYQWWMVDSMALQVHAAAAKAALAHTGQDNHSAGSIAAPNSTSSGSGSAGGSGLATGQLLQLAEGMAGRLLSKQLQGGQQGPTWEEVMLYLGLLQAQGKHDAALKVLRGQLGTTISLPAERREAEAAALIAKGDLPAAAALYQAALIDQPDDWALLLLYLDCLFPATASTQPAITSAAVSQMVCGVEASILPGVHVEGLQALVARMTPCEESDTSSSAAG
eukprot:GHRR01034248.1.p1 GENE.GHRR01034248.1~~GHRR01034248.1.p1  ORF type:complete len:433 (+),score=157.77 GHRR01034248.1:1526-2824(+)